MGNLMLKKNLLVHCVSIKMMASATYIVVYDFIPVQICFATSPWIQAKIKNFYRQLHSTCQM